MDKFLMILVGVFFTSAIVLARSVMLDSKTRIVSLITLNLLLAFFSILKFQENNNRSMDRFLMILVGVFLVSTAVFVRCRILSPQIGLKKTIAAIIFLNVFAIFLCFFILFP